MGTTTSDCQEARALDASAIIELVDLEYANFLEFGTERMAARPFLFPVFERERGQIEGKIERALEPEFSPFMPVP